MSNELLGKHKPSSEWYTPQNIWDRVERTFDYPLYYVTDPCPPGGLPHREILTEDWSCLGGYWYINPPTPAAAWARKAIQTFEENPQLNFIYASFSEAVIWQVPELKRYPTCWVRNRISWIDGNKYIKATDKPNPGYLLPSKSPRNYNAFHLLTNQPEMLNRFKKEFGDLGTIERSFVYD